MKTSRTNDAVDAGNEPSNRALSSPAPWCSRRVDAQRSESQQQSQRESQQRSGSCRAAEASHASGRRGRVAPHARPIATPTRGADTSRHARESAAFADGVDPAIDAESRPAGRCARSHTTGAVRLGAGIVVALHRSAWTPRIRTRPSSSRPSSRRSTTSPAPPSPCSSATSNGSRRSSPRGFCVRRGRPLPGARASSSLEDLQHLTPAQVAELLSLTEPYVHELCRTGRVQATKSGKYWMIPVAGLRQWLVYPKRDVDGGARAPVQSLNPRGARPVTLADGPGRTTATISDDLSRMIDGQDHASRSATARIEASGKSTTATRADSATAHSSPRRRRRTSTRPRSSAPPIRRSRNRRIVTSRFVTTPSAGSPMSRSNGTRTRCAATGRTVERYVLPGPRPPPAAQPAPPAHQGLPPRQAARGVREEQRPADEGTALRAALRRGRRRDHRRQPGSPARPPEGLARRQAERR